MKQMTVNNFDSYPEALSALARDLAGREFSLDEYHIVLCPDRYTQTLERALFGVESGKASGALDLDVLTLSRLSKKLAPRSKTLSTEGGVMITARAVAACAPRLEYYAKAAAFGDFAREVYETLQQITSSDAQPDLEGVGGSTRIKLGDLAAIKAEYDKLKGEYADPADKLFALIESAKDSALLRSAHIYAIGYADATRLIRRVFDVLAAYARSFTLYSAAPPETKRAELTLYCAPDRATEYKKLAVEIRDYLHTAGVGEARRYSDIAVVCDSPRALKRILSEYEIPIYTDETLPLGLTPPLFALNNVYKLRRELKARAAVDCRALVTLCKNPFSGVAGVDAEKLGYELASSGREYVPTDYAPKDPGARRAMRRALDIVEAFDGQSFAAAVETVAEFCDFSGVWEKASELERGTDAVAPIFALTELLGRYGSGEFDTDARAFFSAAQAVNVNSLPRERDCVTVTAASTLRLTAVKKLFIADFSEGIMPPTAADTGLISDAELAILGGAIEPSVSTLNRRARDELKAVVRNAESVFVAYAAADGGCSAFIAELADRINRLDHEEERAALLLSTDAEYVAKFAAVPSAARELVARKSSAHAPSVSRATGKTDAYYAPKADRIAAPEKRTVSVSELSNWFRCPYYRFLHDAVRLGRRKNGFDASDFGDVVHDFMKRFVATDMRDCSRKTVGGIIDEVLEERGIELDGAEYDRIVTDAVDYAALNADILAAGRYSVAKTEYEFKDKMLLGEKAKLRFNGYIDRYDTRDNGKISARIIDYKTGAEEFRLEECYNGCDMQLPLYAAELKYEGIDVTGMFYVRLGKRYNVGDAERAMSGCLVKDVKVALDYDASLVPGGEASRIIPVKLRSDRKGNVVFSGKLSAALMDKEDFDALIARCLDNADVAADELALGYILRSPVEGACKRCPYIGICGGGEPRCERAED